MIKSSILVMMMLMLGASVSMILAEEEGLSKTELKEICHENEGDWTGDECKFETDNEGWEEREYEYWLQTCEGTTDARKHVEDCHERWDSIKDGDD